MPGAKDLIEWLGSWPTFHDAEILEIQLCRSKSSKIVLHTWRMTENTDETGKYVLEKNVIVTLKLGTITDLELQGFSNQNVIADLLIKSAKNEHQITLSPCFGVAGDIFATDLSIEFVAGEPERVVTQSKT